MTTATLTKTEERVVVHHDDGAGDTECGINYYFWRTSTLKKKLRKGWGGVNCVRCLKAKAKQDRIKMANKLTKASKRRVVNCG